MTYDKQTIRNMLATNDKAVCRGVLAIYAYQTAAEQSTEETNQDNGVGFNGADAPILSSFAKQLQKGWTLSEKQLVIARKKMLKYAGQLTNIANSKAEAA